MLYNSASAQKKKGIEYSGFFDTYYFRGPINITGAVGFTQYRGDLCGLLGCDRAPLFYSLGASYQVWPRTYFGAEISYLQLGARTFADGDVRHEMQNTGLSLEVYGKFLLLDKKVTRHGQLRENPFRIRPYISAGFGVYHTLNANFASDSIGWSQVEESGFAPFVLTVPLGLGFQIWLSHRVSIIPEAIYRFALTDRLDGVRFFENQHRMDGYATVGVKVQYTPTAPRVRKKKTKLPPPDEYDGPKGTDYPRKREEKPAPNRRQPPMDDEPQDGGNDGWDNDDQPQQEQPQEDDGWGW